MTRGMSLINDFKFIINNPEFSDIEITCEDGVILHGNRTIIGSRSEVLYKLLFNGMKESTEPKISFPEINSSSMKVIMEYLYTGLVSNEVLTNENLVETFNAADYFQLPGLQYLIVKHVLDNNIIKNNKTLILKFLTRITEKMLFNTNNKIVFQLIKSFSKIPLDEIKLEDISFETLQFFLS